MKSNEKIYSISSSSDFDTFNSWMNDKSYLIYNSCGYVILDTTYCSAKGTGYNELMWNSGLFFKVDVLANGNRVSSSFTFGKNLLAKIFTTLFVSLSFTLSKGYTYFKAALQSL